MYEKILAAAGLSEKEALVYEILLNKGKATASQIYRQSPFKRGLVYKILDELAEKGLIAKSNPPRQVTTFQVEHPYKINDLLNAQAQKINYYKKSIEELMPQLVSNYNLAFNRPGIQFYEGEEGIKKVLADTLTAQELIYTYADVETIEKYTAKINQEYRRKRQKLNIKKRVLALDSPFSRKFMKNYDPESLEIRYIDHRKFPFTSTLQIYDNKVIYISLSKENLIALLIADKNIYQTHKSLFEFHWKYAYKKDQLPPLSKAQ
jgi:sugar-specific transcriptional regulator TrmB